jgi:hypothetical protein
MREGEGILQLIIQLLLSMLRPSIRSHPLALGSGYIIPSLLAIAVDNIFSDSSSGSGNTISHSYGDGNIRMRRKVKLASTIARQPASPRPNYGLTFHEFT